MAGLKMGGGGVWHVHQMDEVCLMHWTKPNVKSPFDNHPIPMHKLRSETEVSLDTSEELFP